MMGIQAESREAVYVCVLSSTLSTTVLLCVCSSARRASSNGKRHTAHHAPLVTNSMLQASSRPRLSSYQYIVALIQWRCSHIVDRIHGPRPLAACFMLGQSAPAPP